jgi:capsular polysaccharide biosynthesis protein
MVNVSVVRDAQIPLKPTSPNPMMNIPLALVLGLIGGLATAFAREFSDHSIPTSLVLEQRVGLRHLGSIPETQEL